MIQTATGAVFSSFPQHPTFRDQGVSVTMNKFRSMPVIVLSAIVAAGLNHTAQAQLIQNGSFETPGIGGQPFANWTSVDQSGGVGTWTTQTGITTSLSGTTVGAVPSGVKAAITDTTAAQSGTSATGSHVLYQTFVVPTQIVSATLSFFYYLDNSDYTGNSSVQNYFSPNSLDYNTPNNQQARMDFMTNGSGNFSTNVSDVLLNVFQTDDNVNSLSEGYTAVTSDAPCGGVDPCGPDNPNPQLTVDSGTLLTFLQGHEGQTLKLRLAETNNLGRLNFGADAINLSVQNVPEPGVIGLLAGAGVAGTSLVAMRMRRRKTKLVRRFLRGELYPGGFATSSQH